MSIAKIVYKCDECLSDFTSVESSVLYSEIVLEGDKETPLHFCKECRRKFAEREKIIESQTPKDFDVLVKKLIEYGFERTKERHLRDKIGDIAYLNLVVETLEKEDKELEDKILMEAGI